MTTYSSDTNLKRNVNLIGAWPSLLSGGLTDCRFPEDPTCRGGVASLAALVRYHSNGNPGLVLVRADWQSPFVQMHPLGWALNRLVLHEMMGFKFFLSTAALLTQNAVDYQVSARDISDLQSKNMPFLLTNALVPPSNSWFPYWTPVYFDEETGLAVLSVAGSGALHNDDQIRSSKGALDYIARINADNGCTDTGRSNYDVYLDGAEWWVPENDIFGGGEILNTSSETILDASTNVANSTVLDNGNNTTDGLKSSDVFSGANRTRDPPTQTPERTISTCYVPVINYADSVFENYVTFVDALVRHDHPPALIIDVAGNNVQNTAVLDEKTWIISYPVDQDGFHQGILEIEGTEIVNITGWSESLLEIPAEAKDDQYFSNIKSLAILADEAIYNDPVVGKSGAMPVHRAGSYRRCAAGECELGNLYTDALRWYARADVAFITSGGLRGAGWPAGNVPTSSLWTSLPFPNTICTGELSGVSLFRLFNYSTSVATFQGERTEKGTDLLQISGFRLTYNTELSESKLVAIDVWNESKFVYESIERLKVYKYATDSFLCSVNDPYPRFLNEALLFDDEVAGSIGSEGHQEIVGQYLMSLNATYDTSIQGRLLNDTSARTPLNLVQTEDSCEPGQYWHEESLTCLQCPFGAKVGFTREDVSFQGVSTSDDVFAGNISLINAETVSIAILLKSAPSWLHFTKVFRNSSAILEDFEHDFSTKVLAGERITFELQASPKSLEPGTAISTVAFGVLDGGSYPGCSGQDAVFDATFKAVPQKEFNHLGPIRFVGFTLVSIVAVAALGSCCWLLCNRKERIVATMQPVFLVAICVGVFTMGLAIVPLSMDDGWVSGRYCDYACMGFPWLLTIGFSIATSALFSKLWRINKLFHAPQFRRLRVSERDVLVPPIILFVLNICLLSAFSAVNPLTWDRRSMITESWKTYGTCTTEHGKYRPVGFVLYCFIGVLNFGALLLAAHQAICARNISDEFSEAKNLGVALFSWVQLGLVGIPVVFLINDDNPRARYFIISGLLFCVCLSMLCLLFVPMMAHLWTQKNRPKADSEMHDTTRDPQHRLGATKISGLQTTRQSSHSHINNGDLEHH